MLVVFSSRVLPAQQVDTHSIPAKSRYNLESFAGKRPLTRAERTNFTETSHYDDVIVFIDSLKKLGAKISTGSIAKTSEGRDLPYVIASRPLVATPAEARRLNRPIAYIQANIHAGEVEGKEAMQAMLRDLLFDKKKNVLDSIVLIVQPIYNADGNEKWGAAGAKSRRAEWSGASRHATERTGLEFEPRLHRRGCAGNQGLARGVEQVESRSVHGSPHDGRQHSRLRAHILADAHADGRQHSAVHGEHDAAGDSPAHARSSRLRGAGLRRLQSSRRAAWRWSRCGARRARCRAGGAPGRGADSAAGRRWTRRVAVAAAAAAAALRSSR